MICTSTEIKVISKEDQCYEIGQDGFKIKIFDSIADFASIWYEYHEQHDIFLGIQYFSAVEACPPEGMKSRYILLYNKEDQLQAMFPFQLKLFEALDSIKDSDIENPNGSTIRKSITKHVRFNTLVSGNIMVSGEYMFCFIAEGYTPKMRFEWMEKILDIYRDILSNDGHEVRMCFTKDVPHARTTAALDLKNTNFKAFNVEPLMVMHLNKGWKTMEEYMSALSSKYRVRTKRAFKKGKDLNFRLCELDEIIARKDEFYPLYMEVFQNVNFTLFQLEPSYFASLQQHLQEKFRLFVAEDNEGSLCGFFTLINNGKELHAHFLGYDKNANRNHQLYHNMLYKMLEIGIEEGFDLIDYGRTALEIKSSLGAVPHEYDLYLKHKNRLANFFVPSIINILNKKTEWQPRHPFK